MSWAGSLPVAGLAPVALAAICAGRYARRKQDLCRGAFDGWAGVLMDLQIEGLRVLVTAGAAGIGLEIVRAFLREGARVHTCDVDDAALSTLAGAHPEVTRSRADVADRAQVAGLF